MNPQTTLRTGLETTASEPLLARRPRLVRDTTALPAPTAELPHFELQEGEMYRISYAIGGAPQQQRRVSRSVAVFGGESERRRWGGELVSCLDFSLPHGRTLSLLADQLVDVRNAELNDRGQWVLTDGDAGGRRRRGGRRSGSSQDAAQPA